MNTLTKLVVTCCVLISGAALAAESAKPERPAPDPQQRQQRVEQMKARWSRADTNKDGQLSREEAQQGMPKLAQHFDKLDANGDGQLTPEELRAAHQARKRDRPQGGQPPGNRAQGQEQ